MTAAPHKFYVYAAVDLATTPVKLLNVYMSRSEARDSVGVDEPGPEAKVRIRRGKLTLFET